MRNAKFRVWDDLNKKWLLGYDYPNLGGFSMMGETMLFGEYIGMLESFKLSEWDYIKIMQSTQIFDMLDKEIYEGDILDDGKGGLGVVVYAAPQFCVRVGEEIFSLAEGKVNIKKLDYTKVVGNIFENANLI